MRPVPVRLPKNALLETPRQTVRQRKYLEPRTSRKTGFPAAELFLHPCFGPRESVHKAMTCNRRPERRLHTKTTLSADYQFGEDLGMTGMSIRRVVHSLLRLKR